ncbi:unnamed protein product, partial [Pelagomonas calceolata]
QRVSTSTAIFYSAASRKLAGQMSVYNAHRPSLIGLPMEPLKGDAVERMSIGTLDEPDE